jgi:tetratricopeptide (TPR) repeat protein
MTLNYYFEAKEAVEPIVDLAFDLDYQRKLPSIYNAIGIYFLTCEEDFPKAFEYLSNAVSISTEIEDYFTLYMASYYLGCALSWNCEFEKGLQSYQKSLDLAVAADNAMSISFAKSTRCSIVYIPRGELDLALRESKDALRMAEEGEDIRTMGVAHFAYGYCCYWKRLFDEAENSLLKAIFFSEKATDFFWGAMASLILGLTYCDMGKYKIATNYFDKSTAFLEIGKLLPSYIYFNKIAKAKAEILNKSQDMDIIELSRLYNKNNLKLLEGWMARHICEILLHVDEQHISEAEEWITKAIETHRRKGVMWHLGMDNAVYAELLRRKGDQPKAKEKLGKAIKILSECGADGWAEKYEKELAALS